MLQLSIPHASAFFSSTAFYGITGHAAGRRTIALVPCPSWLSRRIDPPLLSTHRSALPIPSPLRRTALRLLKNGSNALFSVGSSIPQPLWLTLSTTRDENES